MNEELRVMIEKVASSVKKQFPQVDREDIRQEIWIWALEKDDKVSDYLDGGKAGRRMLWSALRRAGVSYAAVEKARVLGYDPADQFHYSVGQLRELLPLALDRDSWVMASNGSQERTALTSDPAHGNNRLAMICDVRSALEACSEEDKHLLWTAFGLSMDDVDHANVEGITTDALRSRVNRALRRLQKHLGGPKPAPYTGRRAISNAQAYVITKNQEGVE